MTIFESLRLTARATGDPRRFSDAEDETALLRAAAADPSAFAPLYERYVDRVYAYCLRRLESAADAEDVTSAVFARALEMARDYRGGLVSAWLFRIARSLVANHYRGRKPSLSLDDPAAAGDALIDLLSIQHDTPLDTVMEREQRRALRRVIARLKEDDRDLLALRIASGLSAEAVGAVLGKSAGAVRTHTHRLILRLRADLRQELSDEEAL